MRFFLTFAFLIFFWQFSYGLEKCYQFFKEEKYLKSYRCFKKEKNIFYPYALHFAILEADTVGLDTKNMEEELFRYEDVAITHYTYLFLARKYLKENPEKALMYINRISEDALKKEDIPFFLYLKSKILKENGEFDLSYRIEKKLALKYTYDRFYGYETFRNILPTLLDEEIYTAVDTLLKNRMVKRASFLLPLLEETPKKDYYKIKIYSRLGRKKEVKKILSKIDEDQPYYRKILPYKVSYAYKKEEKMFYINQMKKAGMFEKANKIARGYMRLAFYRKNIKDFKFYASLIDRNSKAFSDRVWFIFLNKYRNKDYMGAFLYLYQYKDIFSEKEKNKIYYWLYLSSKHFDISSGRRFLRKAAFSKHNDFYKVLASKKLGIKRVSFSKYTWSTRKPRLTKNHKLIFLLKKKGLYKYAYLEAEFLKKRASSVKDYIKLSVVFPEKTARYFSYRYFRIDKAYPKPFIHIDKDSLVYAVMRQESFFDAYALSYANAVGLMQIIPSTGRWIAKKLRVKDFSPYDLFDPEINIKFGKWYIYYLLDRFKGNIFHAIAAYNGGGRVVRRTLKYNKISDPAEFVEYIPYLQTRNYVKKVYTNYFVYKELSREYVYRSY